MHLRHKANADTLAKLFRGQKVLFKILRSLLVNHVCWRRAFNRAYRYSNKFTSAAGFKPPGGLNCTESLQSDLRNNSSLLEVKGTENTCAKGVGRPYCWHALNRCHTQIHPSPLLTTSDELQEVSSEINLLHFFSSSSSSIERRMETQVIMHIRSLSAG